MNILWASNYSSNSAYAIQARMIVPALQALGYKVVVYDIRAGSGAMTSQIGNVTVLPAGLDALGNDSLPVYYQQTKSEVLFSLVDVWGLSPNAMKHVNWYPFTPIDHAPVPPAVLESLKAARGVIAISRFGQAELRKKGIDSWYCPHGIDPAIWYPALTTTDTEAARKRAGLPADKFVVAFVGVNDSNPSRKGIPELLAAWDNFHRAHPDTVLYMHTTPLGNIPVAGNKNGVDIEQIIATYGIDPRSVILPDQYRLRTGIPATELADIMRASDVFILPSRGEGFGVPLIEAQHCGTPVITTDFGGGAELCASKWLIEYETAWSWQGSTYANPGIASITERLEAAYAERGNIARRVEAAQFARDYEIDYVTQRYIAPTVSEIAETVVLGRKVAS